MFNLSPQDIVGLQEAYQSVYLQEDVEQLDELTGGQIAAAVGGPVGYLGYKAVKGFAQGLTGGGDKPAAKPAAPTQSRFAGARDAAFKKAQAIKGSPVVGAKPAPTPAAKPAAPTPAAKPAAAKPAPTPAAKPAPTTSTTSAAKPSAMDQWAKANPRLAQAQKIRQQGGSRAEVNKALYNKGTAAATSTPTVVKAGVDLFDIIKGHLLDEGFADTEEAALAIMTNMSDEWRNEILDELYKGKHGQSETEYMAGRSDAGKRISGDEKEGPASYASRWHKGSEPTKPGQKPKNVQKLSKSEKEEIAYRRANLKKEEVEQIDEISADLALKASKAADIKRGKLAAAGDKEGAARKAAQAKRLYGKQAKIRLNREEVDEAVKGADPEMRRIASVERKSGDKRLPPSKGKGYAAHAMQQAAYVDKKTKGKHIPGYAYAEEVDIFDVVLEFLQTEGFAETLEEAEWMMANMIDEEAIDIILGESALGTMAVLGGMAAGRAIHGKLQGRKEKKEREAKRRTSDYLTMKSRTKNAVFRDRRDSGDTREEFELWVNGLVEEGYDLSDYTWDEMYEFYLDEALTGERYRKVMKKPGGTAYSRKVSADPAKRATRGGMGGESDFGAGDRGSGNKAARRAGTYKEYDVNEAQHARENPEKYEREQAKKSAPVRGERTPMPPRGDKRREEFEKWYAKQMGR